MNNIENNEEIFKSFYECKRCFIKFNQKIDIQRHINRKKPCIRILESYKYKEEELKSLSLTIISCNNQEQYQLKCNYCNKVYINNQTLKIHIKNVCKIKKNLDKNNNNQNINNQNINNLNTNNLNTNNQNINNLNNPNNTNNTNNINTNTDNYNILNNDDKNITNIINNNITNIININNINVQVIKSFDEDYDISNINNDKKLILLLTESKFTKTLEKLLENESNLNVLIDQKSNYGFVYCNNEFKKMDIKDISSISMNKLCNILKLFYDDISNPNIYELDLNMLYNEINKIYAKYEKYNSDLKIKNKVDNLLASIYSKKNDETYKITENIQNNEIEGY